MTLGMTQQLTIRQRYVEGEPLARISADMGVDWKTASKYAKREDFSPKAPVVRRRPVSKLDEFTPFIDEILVKDRTVWRKQRHTAKRIWERLRDEKGAQVSVRTVERYVARRKAELGVDGGGSLELQWPAGVAQADFGDADVVRASGRVRMHYLAVSFPFSNMGYMQVFGGVTAECVCQGLKDVFTWIGGVPVRVVFDNATGIGRRRGEVVVESELFERFRTHFGFEATYCNPRSGKEKGNVERKVAFVRNELLVPIPRIANVQEWNHAEFQACEDLEWSRMHYDKGQLIGDLYTQDRQALRALPGPAFDAVSYKRVRADGWGGVTVDSVHHYSGSASLARQEVIVALRAHTVSILEARCGGVVAVHERAWGSAPTRSVDPAGQIEELARKPGGWRNSAVRCVLPANVVAALDGLDRHGLARGLRQIAGACRDAGQGPTWSALEKTVSTGSVTDFCNAAALAARIAGYGLDPDPLPGPDLAVYDRLGVGA